MPRSARNLIAAACVLHILAYLQAVPVHVTDMGLFTSHLGYFLSMLVVSGGAPPDFKAHVGLGVILALYVLGLLLGERGRPQPPT